MLSSIWMFQHGGPPFSGIACIQCCNKTPAYRRIPQGLNIFAFAILKLHAPVVESVVKADQCVRYVDVVAIAHNNATYLTRHIQSVLECIHREGMKIAEGNYHVRVKKARLYNLLETWIWRDHSQNDLLVTISPNESWIVYQSSHRSLKLLRKFSSNRLERIWIRTLAQSIRALILIKPRMTILNCVVAWNLITTELTDAELPNCQQSFSSTSDFVLRNIYVHFLGNN